MSMLSEQVNKIRTVAKCVYLATDKEVADDIASTLHQAADTIEALSTKLSATNGGGWIACEDRLPEVGQIVIVCQSFREIHGNPGTSTSIGQYLGSDDNLQHWRFISYRVNIYEKLTDAYMVDNYQIIGDNEYVISWHPLPEPYHL